jgi:hypothetical protein
MPSQVLRLVVLLLVFVLQAGSWRSGEGSSACSGGARAGAVPPDDDGARGCDDAEDSSEELSALDDSLGSDGVPAAIPNWRSPAPSARGYAWADGLAPGRPAGDAPFKPPRA